MFSNETKFLVVDDSQTMRKILRNLLLELGFSNVEEADDGARALPLIRQAQADGKPFQLIISDINMPEMMGTELLKTCKKDPSLKQIPFIMSTIERERHHIAQALIDGASEYIIKPYDADGLKGKLEKVFAKIK